MNKIIINNWKSIIICLLLTFIFCIPLFDDSLYVGYDLSFHLNRLIGIADSIRDGQIIPKLYPYTNFGYGYASPLFYCDLFLYPFALLYIFKLPILMCYKIMILFYTFIGIFSMNKVGKLIFKDNNMALIITIVFTFLPFRFIDCYLRNALGQYIAFSLIPLLLYVFYSLFYLKKNCYVLLGITFSLFLLCHNISFILYCILFLVLILVYIIYNYKDSKEIIRLFKCILKGVSISILLTLWFTLPMLEQFLDQEFFINTIDKKFDIGSDTANIFSMLNIFMNIDGYMVTGLEMSKYGLGLILICIPMYNYFNNSNIYIKALTSIFYFFILVVSGLIRLDYILPIEFIQFSFRYYIILSLLVLIPFTHAISKLNKYLIMVLLFSYSIYLFPVYNHIINGEIGRMNNKATYDNIFVSSNNDQFDYNEFQISGAEYLPINYYNSFRNDTTFIKKVEDKNVIDYIYEYDRYFSEIKFNHNSDTKDTLMLPLSYYKGYKAYYIDNEEYIELETINNEKYRKVSIETVPGNYCYIVKYVGTNIQFSSMVISLLTILILIIFRIKLGKR